MSIRSRRAVGVVFVVAAAIGAGGLIVKAGVPQAGAPSPNEWPTYGHDPGGMRFSPLAEITPANVARLDVAWTYHMKPSSAAAGRAGFSSSSVTPLVVGGVMYIATPYFRVVALDSSTGKELWAYQLPAANPSTRGVEYWPGDGRTPAQIVFGSTDGKLYSLDAKTGAPNDAFGDHGIVNLNTPEILQGLPGRDGLSSPPTVYKNLVITGGTTQENPPRDQPATCARGTCARVRSSGRFDPFHVRARNTTTRGRATAGGIDRASTCGAF
jgi:quinoprotein glucose dehydrogenase